MCSFRTNKVSYIQRHHSDWAGDNSSAVFIKERELALQPFQISSSTFSKEEMCECFLGEESGHRSLEELQVIMVPRCKHLLALFYHPNNSVWPSPPPLAHGQVQLDCQAVLCLPPSLNLFIFLSACLKNHGRNNLHGHKFTICPLISAPCILQLRQMFPFECVCVCVCWAFIPSKCNLFLHSGKAPLLLSACQAPSGSWQASCQQRPSRPVKGTRVSHFPWSRWRCQLDIPLTRHP